MARRVDADRLLVVFSDVEMGAGGALDDFPRSDFLSNLLLDYCTPEYDGVAAVPDVRAPMVEREPRWPLWVIGAVFCGILSVAGYGARSRGAEQAARGPAVPLRAVPGVADPMSGAPTGVVPASVQAGEGSPATGKARPRRSSTSRRMAAHRRAGGAGDVLADGVPFTSTEAEAALRFVNDADEAALRAAGITGRQVRAILDGRPFEGLGGLADTPYVGRKTVEKVRAAAR